MKKMNLMNGIQQLIIAVCIMLVITGVFITKGNVVKARGEKTSKCSLQSVTLEIDGKEYTFEGDMDPFVVDKATDWKNVFSEDNIKVVDYTILANEECTHEDGHDTINISVYGEQWLSYSDEGGNVYSTWTDDAWNDANNNAYLQMNMWLDNNEYSNISVLFSKQYNITYSGIEGATIVGSESLPSTYVSGVTQYLPAIEKGDYIFKGWTCETADGSEEEEEAFGPSVAVNMGWYSGDITLTANWEEGTRADISDSSKFYIGCDKESSMYSGKETGIVVTVCYSNAEEDESFVLEEGMDYIVSYENNIEIAAAESPNSPTAIITGIGAYTGTVRIPFAITKATLYTDGSFYAVDRATLSTLDLNTLEVCSSVTHEVVAGTWEWSDPSTPIERKDIDEDGETPNSLYKATFTPTDTEHYETLTTDIPVMVGLASVEDWTVSFESEPTFTYTGEKYEPKVIVTDGENSITVDKDYWISYVNNVNAADKTAKKAPTVVITGMGDYVGTISLTFTIEKATPEITTIPTASAIEEGQKLSDSKLTGGAAIKLDESKLKGTFTWKDGTITPSVADSGVTKYTVVFTPTSTNYAKVEMDVLVMVNEKPKTPKDDTTKETKDDTTEESSNDQELVVGEKVSDKSNKATYKVTKSKEGKVEVTYVAPTSKKKTVSIPATVTLADGTTAKVTSISAKAFKGNTKIETVTISKNVKTIGKEAFSGCKNLKKVKSAANVTSIGKNAFANCKNLTSVAMGSKVTTIGEKAFYKCTKLTKITIPKNVKSIGKSAFQGCSKLKTINIKTTKLTKNNVKKDAFKGIYSKAKIDVPNSKVKSYKSILRARGVGKNVTIK